jgi:hypothetical protein
VSRRVSPFVIGGLVCALVAPCAARAQGGADAEAGPSFLIARYASRSSLGMYSGYQAGPALLVVGLLHNPRTEYQEAMAAIGHPFSLGHGSSAILAGAGAYTNTGWFAQLYVIPSLQFGRFFLHATVELAEPLSDAGTRGVFVSPGNALYDLGKGFSAGLGYYDDMEHSAAPYHGLGPALRRNVPHGSLTFEWIADMTGTSDEFRMTVRSSF